MDNNTLISQEIIKIDGRQEVVKTFLNCISGLEQYSNKCLEELRYEDYILNNKYPVIPPLIPSSSSLSINGSYQVKYNGSKIIEVNRNINNNNIYSDSIFKSISAMNEYNMNSFEEIRYQDYLSGYKYCELTKKEKELLDVNNNNNNNNHFTESMCPICLETISNVNILYNYFNIILIYLFFFLKLKKQNIRLCVTPCGHILCNICTSNLIQSHLNKKTLIPIQKILLDCPSCRKKIDQSLIHDLYL